MNIVHPVGGHQRSQRLIGLATNILTQYSLVLPLGIEYSVNAFSSNDRIPNGH